VIDGMNPSVIVCLQDIKKYFQIYDSPIVNSNKPIQKQIDDVPLYTGQYFSIIFDSDTFKDSHPETPQLQYKLILNTTENNETIPSWISLNGLTLRGIAPEEFFNRDIGFALIANNEFKNLTVPFKLHIRISTPYAMKLGVKFGPYIVTLIGLLITANKIYNVLCKRRYRYRKNFFVQIGQEITNEKIFPLFFIKQEKIESHLIFNEIMKKSMDGNLEEEDGTLVAKEKILEEIKETVEEKIPLKKRNKLKIYLRGVDCRKQIVEKLVINKLIFWRLEKDGVTKKVFEEIKNKWPEIVEWDLISSGFKVNMKRFDQVLPANIKESIADITNDSEENFLQKNERRLNMNLLIDAIEAYIFERHCIDELAIKCRIEFKEKLERNWINSFLKRDLESLNYNQPPKVSYGIDCRFEDDSLVFYGIPCKNFKDKTLVIQITNKRHRIRKEIWIFEGEDYSSKDIENNENEPKEQHYEIF